MFHSQPSEPPTNFASSSSDSDAGSPDQARDQLKRLQKRRAAKRARSAERKRQEAAAEDLRQVELPRLSPDTIQLESERLEQQQRRVLEKQIQRETKEWVRQRAFMNAMRRCLHEKQLRVTWDILDTPMTTEVTPPAEEVEKADASIKIQENEDFWDLWIQFDDCDKPLPHPIVANKCNLRDSLFRICSRVMRWFF